MAVRDRSRRRSRGRSGVFRLNSGSSPFGRTSSLSLNRPGGSFMSGRSAGGSPAASGGGPPGLLGALVQGPPASTAGNFDVGPPPVVQTPAPPFQPPQTPSFPSFTPPAPPSTYSNPWQIFSAPTFAPIVAPVDERKLRFF